MHATRTRFTTTVMAAALIIAAWAGASDTGGSAATATPITETSGVPAPSGPAAPTTPFALFDGSETTFGAYEGTPLVVNFWASWCPSCVAEMSQAFRPAQEHFEQNVTFIGINITDRRDLAEELLAETGVRWVNAEDPRGELYLELGGLGMPFTVFIDAAGAVVEAHNGPLSDTQLFDLIETELLG